MEPIAAKTSSANAGTASPGAGGQADAAHACLTPTLGGISDPLKGHVLDYLPFESMEVALSVLADVATSKKKQVGVGGNRGGANSADDDEEVDENGGVAGAITTLNITSGSQLDGLLTSKFPNVEEVNCLSFLRGPDDGSPAVDRMPGAGHRTESDVVVCTDTAYRLVPILAAFDKLRRIYIGGTFRDQNGTIMQLRHEDLRDMYRLIGGRTYRALLELHRGRRPFPNTNGWQWPQVSSGKSASAASSLANNLMGALKSGVISPLESMGGVAYLFEPTVCLSVGSRSWETVCENCLDVCAHLPLHNAIEDFATSCNCAVPVAVYEAVAGRSGAKNMIGHPQGRCTGDMQEDIWDYLDFFRLRADSVEKKELKIKLMRLGAWMACAIPVLEVLYVDRPSLELLDRMIAVGWRPNTLDKAKSWIHLIDSCSIIAKGSLDALVSRGFPISAANFIVLDEMMEPALKELAGLIVTPRWMRARQMNRGSLVNGSA